MSPDVSVEVVGHGTVSVDVGYGGAFYAIARAQDVGLSFETATTKQIIETANRISGNTYYHVIHCQANCW